MLIQIQHELFDLGSELCLPGYRAIAHEHVTHLETCLDELNQTLEPLKEFLLPGGHISAAHCHLARTICRRAERIMVHLGRTETLNVEGLKYINRLSDLLFVMARAINHYYQIQEPLWNHERKKPGQVKVK